MAAPKFAREGITLGGLTGATAAITARTNSDGADMVMQVYADSAFANLIATGSLAALNAGNNYQATSYVNGLQAGTRYYWRAKATDGGAGITLSDSSAGFSGQAKMVDALCTGSFTTFENRTAERTWKIGIGGCFQTADMGRTNQSSQHASVVFGNIINMNLDGFIHQGDMIYPDQNQGFGAFINRNYVDDLTSKYGANVYYSQQLGTDDSTIERWRTDWITAKDGCLWANDGSAYNTNNYSLGHLMASVPGYFMWDDHDRCRNGMNNIKVDFSSDPTNDRVKKRIDGHQSGHEFTMDLNKVLCEETQSDFSNTAYSWSTDTNATPTPNTNTDAFKPVEWYHIDRYPVRFIVVDLRSMRGFTGSESDDNPSPIKTILGNEDDLTAYNQKAWFKHLISNNPMPFTVFCSMAMLDGDHFWEANGDNWKTYSYEVQELMNYIVANGNPDRTVIINGDSHFGSVMRYPGYNDIISFTAANNNYGAGPAQGWPRALGDEIMRGQVRSDNIGIEVSCASRNGATHEEVRTQDKWGKRFVTNETGGHQCIVTVEAGEGYMTISLVETYPRHNWDGANHAPKTIYSRTYR